MQETTFKVSYTGGPSLELARSKPETITEFTENLVANGDTDTLALADANFVVNLQNFVRTRMKESNLSGSELEAAAQKWASGYRYSAGRSSEKVVDLSGQKVSSAVLERLEAAGIKVL